MKVRRLDRSTFGIPEPGARGTRARKPLNFESLEPRNIFAACDATIDSNWDTYGNGVAHTGYVQVPLELSSMEKPLGLERSLLGPSFTMV